MRYPSSFVLVHGDVEAEILKQNGGLLTSGRRHLSAEQALTCDVSTSTSGSAGASDAMLQLASTGFYFFTLKPLPITAFGEASETAYSNFFMSKLSAPRGICSQKICIMYFHLL